MLVRRQRENEISFFHAVGNVIDNRPKSILARLIPCIIILYDCRSNP